MPLPAGVETVTVTSGQPLTLPDGTPMQGVLYFSGPDVVTIAGQDVLLGGEIPVKLVNGTFSVDLVATDATGMNPSGWTYTVRAVLSNAPSWVRYISLPKATPSVRLADVVVPDPVAGSYATLVDASAITAAFLAKAQNLADLPDKPAARTNLGLGAAATRNVGTGSGTVAAGDDPRFSNAKAWVFDVTTYGAKGDGRLVTDGAMTSGSAVLTSATANFQPQDVGKAISVKGAAIDGVTTLVTTIASRQSATQVTLATAAATTVSGALVIWGTDDTAAFNAAVDAAEQYLATHTYAQVFAPPLPYVIAGPLRTDRSGNGQIVFGPQPMSGDQKTLHFAGVAPGAPVRTWLQTQPFLAGSCLISLGVYGSINAQTNDINAHGNPAVISGPNEGSGYGVSATFSNTLVAITGLTIITTHSTFGLTYSAANLWGCAKAYVDGLAYGTAGTVATPSTDYTSPALLGNGASVGLLLPAPGNNDHVVAPNVSCNGGYTYGIFITEHALVGRYMALYCWAGIVAIGTYRGSVGSVHAMKVISASVEACTHELYIYGPGSQGVGPIIDIDQLSTESGTPNIAGTSTSAMNAALGRVRLTGLFTESGVSVSAPTGIELVNGSIPRAIKRKTSSFTVSPVDRTLICDTSGGAITATLPAADYCPVEYCFRNTGANNLVLDPAGAQTINGAATLTLTSGQTARVQALFDGTAWGWYAI
ncbi:hypothetical protein ACF1AY_15840 [Streptomyces sp. NPDC014776]|uniref:hypothetical protein n=1 Tax=unclassified Streptomyces TaxID=2593676 RepID=UPI0036FEB42B